MKSKWNCMSIMAFGVVAVAATGANAGGPSGQAVKEVVTPEGVFTVPANRPIDGQPPMGGPAGSGGWTHNFSPAIGSGVALGAAHTWASVELNDPRLIAFETDGFGVPIFEVPSEDAGAFLPGVAAARNADRSAYIDRTAAGNVRVRAFTSASSDHDWEYVFAPNYESANSRLVAVSRDGSVVAAAARDFNTPENLVVFFNGADGSIISTWTQPDGGPAAIDLTDDGSIALVSIGNQPRVVDTAAGTLIWGGTGSGAGNVDYRISGDGGVIAVGGFSFQIYQWDGFTYNQIINFSAPSSWFGRGVAVSRDGSTVASAANNFSNQALTVRMWDVATQTLIGEHVLPPVFGTLQTSLTGGENADDGSLFAFSTWGDGTGVYPEVQVYDRDVNLVAEIDMIGSANGVSMSPTGRWVAGICKGTHANTFGNGGEVVVIELDVDVPCPGDLTGSGSVGVPDLLELLGCWGPVAPGCEAADLTGSGSIGVPDLLDLLAQWGPCP